VRLAISPGSLAQQTISAATIRQFAARQSGTQALSLSSLLIMCVTCDSKKEVEMYPERVVLTSERVTLVYGLYLIDSPHQAIRREPFAPCLGSQRSTNARTGARFPSTSLPWLSKRYRVCPVLRVHRGAC